MAWNSLLDISVIHRSAAVASGVFYKLYCLRDVSVAIEMLCHIALYKCNTNIDTYYNRKPS